MHCQWLPAQPSVVFRTPRAQAAPSRQKTQLNVCESLIKDQMSPAKKADRNVVCFFLTDELPMIWAEVRDRRLGLSGFFPAAAARRALDMPLCVRARGPAKSRPGHPQLRIDCFCHLRPNPLRTRSIAAVFPKSFQQLHSPTRCALQLRCGLFPDLVLVSPLLSADRLSPESTYSVPSADADSHAAQGKFSIIRTRLPSTFGLVDVAKVAPAARTLR